MTSNETGSASDVDSRTAGGLENIKASHALSGDVRALDSYYQDWAATYDADVSAEGYVGPAYTARLAAAVADDAGMNPAEAAVLDAGCGTGLVGAELAKLGFRVVDGVDLSHPMAEQAQAIGCYQKAIGGVDLNKHIDCLEDDHYDLVTCCGVFTVGHVEATALDHIAATARPGGVLVISTRNSYLHDSDFAQYVDEHAELDLLASHDDGPYIDEEGATYWVLERSAR